MTSSQPTETEAAQLRTLAADADIDLIVAALLADGGLIVEGLLDQGTLAAVNSEVDPFVEAADPAAKQINESLDAFFGKRTRHVTSLTAKSPAFVHEVLLHPVMAAICDRILLPSCARYQLNIASILDRGPGADAQMLHRDEDVWVHVPRPRPTLQLASVWALVDMHRGNGATQVVAGSHLDSERFRAVRDEEIAYAEMPAGSAVIYLGSTLHGGGANTTEDQWRRAFHLSFCLGWLRTEENNYLGTPPSVAKELPRAAQELLGYAVHDAIADLGGYLGILDGRDPVDLLQEGLLG
jgi:ectoine hydroxylase-related dioxygenase (phytanoyl-CoA dioxygenase family)